MVRGKEEYVRLSMGCEGFGWLRFGSPRENRVQVTLIEWLGRVGTQFMRDAVSVVEVMGKLEL